MRGALCARARLLRALSDGPLLARCLDENRCARAAEWEALAVFLLRGRSSTAPPAAPSGQPMAIWPQRRVEEEVDRQQCYTNLIIAEQCLRRCSANKSRYSASCKADALPLLLQGTVAGAA